MAIGENWPYLMYTVMDTVGPDLPSKPGNNPAAGLFFVCIQVVCHFFMLEIFTGVIIDNFSRMKALNHVRHMASPLAHTELLSWSAVRLLLFVAVPNRSPQHVVLRCLQHDDEHESLHTSRF